MKTSIRRLENMKLNEEQIRKVFGWDEDTYTKRKKYPSNTFEVEDLPLKIDAIVKGYDLNDLKKVKLFDEIYEVNNLPKPDEENDYKMSMISEFPKLLKHIKISRINSEISEKEELKLKLMEQLARIDSEIGFKREEINMINLDIKMTKTPAIAEAKEEIKPMVENDLVVLDDYAPKVMRESKKGNLFLSVKVVVIDLVKEGDCVLFQGKKYIVSSTNRRACNMYINPVEENDEPVEITKPTEPTEKKTLTESDIRIDYVSKTGLNVCIRDVNLFDEVKYYDKVKLAREGKIELYEVRDHNDRMKRVNLTYLETILENKSYDKEEEKKRFKFW